MARFEVPAGWVAQAYRFALDPTSSQVRALASHAGAARFAHNHMLALVKATLEQRAAERSYGLAEDQLTPSRGWSLPAPACQEICGSLGQFISFVTFVESFCSSPSVISGQRMSRSPKMTAKWFSAPFQPRVPVPRSPLARTCPSPSM